MEFKALALGKQVKAEALNSNVHHPKPATPKYPPPAKTASAVSVKTPTD